MTSIYDQELSPDSLEAALAKQAATIGPHALVEEMPSRGGEIPDPSLPPSEPAAPPEPSPSPAPGDAQPDELTPEELVQLKALNEWFKSNPEKLAAILQARSVPVSGVPDAASQPQAALSPQTTAPAEPPPGVDLDDPNIRFLWDQHLASQAQLQVLHREVSEQRQRYISEQVSVGVQRFVAAHPELSEFQVAAIRNNPQVGVLFNAYGQQQGTDLASAAEKSLNDGIYLDESVRVTVLQQQQTQAQAQALKDVQRQQAWSGLSGSRATPAPAPVDVSKMSNSDWSGTVTEAFRVAANGSPV